jgi:diacylglycerol kinase family enzyme
MAARSLRIGVLANPVAGKGRGGAAAGQLTALLEARGHRVERRLTAGPGDARRLAAALASPGEPLDRIVVVGGDGTLNEVVNGLADPARVPVLQLGVGTANMLARDLGWPRRPEGLADVIEHGEVRRMDLGRVGGDRFLMNVSCGFDAMVVRHIREHRRGTLGFRGYVRPVLATLRHYREPRLAVRVEGAPPREVALVLASNLRNYGGLFCMTEAARFDSGQLDVALFGRARLGDLVRYGVAGLLRRASRTRGIDIVGARGLSIASLEPAPVPVQVDGDHWGTTPVEIGLDPAALSVVVPPAALRGRRRLPAVRGRAAASE